MTEHRDIPERPAPQPDPADRAVTTDEVHRVLLALETLPDEQRRAVVLAAWHAHTAAEIADHEGVPLGTAKTRIRNGLGKLRSALEGRR